MRSIMCPRCRYLCNAGKGTVRLFDDASNTCIGFVSGSVPHVLHIGLLRDLPAVSYPTYWLYPQLVPSVAEYPLKSSHAELYVRAGFLITEMGKVIMPFLLEPPAQKAAASPKR